MTRSILVIGFVCVLAAAVFGYVRYFTHGTVEPSHITLGSSATSYVVPQLTKMYQNDEYRFSLQIPDDFTAREVTNEDGSKAITLENGKGDGVQITVAAFTEDLHNLTVDRIKQDVPDLVVTDPQTVEVGSTYSGVAFKSNNDAFNGASRDVWFVFRANLYQISTYERLDPLLVAMFNTWKFY